MDLHRNNYTWLSASGSAALSVLALRGPAVHTLFANSLRSWLRARNRFIRGIEVIDEVVACAEPHFVVATFHGERAVRAAVYAALGEAGFQVADIRRFGGARFEHETLAM